ncbi:MAG: hypothetical protein H8D56_17625 [Planctomycetes bacterium]|nr:hypothetical protein [Planctomycetota bacterium]MBL7142623.1 hypothetical protein [Phycisphaerae bacterium]
MTKEELEILWKDKNNWWCGAIYHCKDDPRLVVPKPVKWTGWTMNFAYPWRAVSLIIVILLAASLPIFIEMKLNVANPVVLCITLIVIAVLIIGYFKYLSSKTE